MKVTITLTLTLIISYASIGQKITILKSDTAIMKGYYINPTESQYYKNLLYKSSIDDGRSQFQFYGENNRPKELLRLNSKGDTLEINIPPIKYIKIDGKVYEIKRTTELVEVNPTFTTRFGGVYDTLSIYRQKYLKEVRKIDSITGLKGKITYKK